ncbi:hypothetical protein SV7mr_36660 [Stieleria bergensis]|uniref:Uncharacterized protein n=1 Tax=Stieleria bergensis TaxID=2528025 RepID=A0A517SYB3_9BACT|nr:hypothetical protein SV7mr_36660 [Planctomycetes bacterium SV_7m_r]
MPSGQPADALILKACSAENIFHGAGVVGLNGAVSEVASAGFRGRSAGVSGALREAECLRRHTADRRLPGVGYWKVARRWRFVQCP